jgi:putative DNA primase/helicase
MNNDNNYSVQETDNKSQNDSTQQSEIRLTDFLAAFFPDVYEIVCLRTFRPKGAPGSFNNRARKWQTFREQLSEDSKLQREIINANKTRGIYFVVNSGGDKDADITRYNSFFVESDGSSLEEQHAKLDAAPIATSIRVETLRSVHAYYLIDGGCTEEEWHDIQVRLIAYFDGDKSNKNPSRTMRLPFFNHVDYNADNGQLSYKTVNIVQFNPERRYTVEEMQKAFPELKQETPNRKVKEGLVTNKPSPNQSQTEFNSWDELNAELKRRIMAHPTAKMGKDGWWHCKGICHNGRSDTAIMFNPATGAVKCMAECAHRQLLNAFGLPDMPNRTSLLGGRKLQIRNIEVTGNNVEIISRLTDNPTTDVGNAECMSALYSSTLRYCHTRKKWLLWNGVRWTVDECNKARKFTVNMVRARQQAAVNSEDSRTREQVGRWGLRSENVARIDATLKLAEAIEPFATDISKYDANPFLVTTENGTLNLEDGTFRQSNPNDLLTMQLGTAFLPDALASRWEQFLQEVFNEDEELIDYIQCAVGYCLTGETKEQNIFLCYGSGANGKSVFLEVVSNLLGDYASAASFETFNAGHRNEAGYDLAVLKGKRVVTVIETNEDKYLDEAKVKAVTGQDLITCRHPYGDFFTYKPQFKIWMAMNHKPVMRGTDKGLWRRIHLIPFTQSFEGRADKDLIAKLRDELPGILNWALDGLRKWQEKSLVMPKAVREATEEYRRESDSVGQWLEERTKKVPEWKLRSQEGYDDYRTWALERGEHPYGLKKWRQYLIERGFKIDRDNNGVFYWGLRLERFTGF